MKCKIFSPVLSTSALRKSNRVGLAVCGLLLSGCFSIGHQFPAGQVSSIRIGETTQNDIYTMFGAPWRTGSENGLKTWTYGDYQYNLFSDSNAEDLLIKFDKRGMVSSFSYNTSKRSK